MLGTVLGGSSFIVNGKQFWAWVSVDLDQPAEKPSLVELSFLGHAIAIDPRDPRRGVVFEKKGPGGAEVRLERGTKATPLPTAPNRRYYGHGSFSGDGRLLYTVEAVVDENLRGVLVVRDGDTLAELGVMDTFGTSPHDLVFIDGGRTMVVTNGGGPLGTDDLPCVTWIDVESRKLLDTLTLPSPRANTGHVALTAGGDVAVVSAPRDGLSLKDLGAVTLRPAGRPAVMPTDGADRMIGETLSVVIHEPTRTVVATQPDANLAWAYDLDTAALRHVWSDMTEPRGVCLTLDGRWLVFSHRLDGTMALSLVDPVTFEVHQRLRGTFITGSHVFARAL